MTKDIRNLFATKDKNILDHETPVYQRISLSENQLSNFERYNELLIYDYYDVVYIILNIQEASGLIIMMISLTSP